MTSVFEDLKFKLDELDAKPEAILTEAAALEGQTTAF